MPPSTASPSTSRRHGGGGCRWWRWRTVTITRGDLLTVLVAATLCSASYCLAIWHNSRGAADSRILGHSAGVVAAASWPCGRDAAAGVAEAAGDSPLDFETHHSAESAGLSVSAAATTRRARRILSGATASAGLDSTSPE